MKVESLPKINDMWNITGIDNFGKIVSAECTIKSANGVILNTGIKTLKNQCTKVTRDLFSPSGVQEVISLFDANGQLIHSKIKYNGKLVGFSRNSLKSVKSYTVKPHHIIKLLKKILLKK